MGASILDLINANPVSRLPNSEFRTLQGLRNALRLEIEKTFTKNQLLLKVRKGRRRATKDDEYDHDADVMIMHHLRPGRD